MAPKTDNQKIYYRNLKQTNPMKLRFWAIKAKCKQYNLPFDLTEEYLNEIWTGFCGISKLEIKLVGERHDPLHAEIDRIDPSKGYVKGNIHWVSRKFNQLKSDATFAEIKMLYDYFDQLRKEYA